MYTSNYLLVLSKSNMYSHLDLPQPGHPAAGVVPIDPARLTLIGLGAATQCLSMSILVANAH